MFIGRLLSWWYTDGWKFLFENLQSRAKNILLAFSVSQLAATLFAPWRRIVSYPSDGIEAKFRAALDNLFSRSIGFVVRLIVILTAFLTLFITALFTVIEIIIWPFIPPLVVGFIIVGVIW